MITVEIESEVIPFDIPNKVKILVMDGEEYVDLNFFTSEKLSELCEVFKSEVFKRANRDLPPIKGSEYYLNGKE